jgi:hypothetical protein
VGAKRSEQFGDIGVQGNCAFPDLFEVGQNGLQRGSVGWLRGGKRRNTGSNRGHDTRSVFPLTGFGELSQFSGFLRKGRVSGHGHYFCCFSGVI